MAGPNPGTRQRMSREQRHDLILQHAIEVFGNRGYHNASMDDVAEHAGISKALVYQHFESKNELYLAVLKTFQENMSDAIMPAWTQDVPPRERFWRGLVAFFEFIEQNKKAWGVLYREEIEIEDEIVKGIHGMNAELAAQVAAMFQQEIAGRDLDPLLMSYSLVAGHAVVGACHALADYWLDHPEQTRNRLATVAMAVTWQGLERLVENEPAFAPTQEMLERP
jgi:AcrR family transcriptional regulator